MEKKERETLIDVLRGFAMVCVVLGHCIQEGSGTAFSENAMYFQDRVYQFLYSFHMPLFMLISGYLAWKSIDEAKTSVDRTRLFIRRCVYLLIPILGWSLIDQVNVYIQNQMKNYQLLPKYLLHNAIVHILTNLWFLWAILICFLLTWFMHYFFRDNVWVYIMVFALMFFSPDGLGLGVYKYMIPYYLAGFYYHKYLKNCGGSAIWKEWEKHRGYNMYLLVSSGMFYALLFSFFQEKYFIYLTGYKLLGKQISEQLWIDAYRFMIGLIGSLFFIMMWSFLITVKEENICCRILAKIGQKSLGVYILSGYVIMYPVRNMTTQYEPDYLINVLEAVIVLVLSVVICTMLERIPFLKKLVGAK